MTMQQANPNIHDFYIWMTEDQWLSPKTAQRYQLYMKIFMKDKGPDYVLTRADVTNFICKKMETVEPTTCNFIQMAFKKYCEYLIALGVSFDVTIFKLERIKGWNRIPDLMSRKEVDRMINAPDKATRVGFRDNVLLQLLYFMGLRIGEALGIQTFDIEESSLFIRHSKGGGTRRLPLMQELKDLMHELAKQRIDKTNHFIFQARQGQRLQYEVAYNRVLDYVRRTGIEKNITPHSFRHAFATHLMESGVDVRIVQQLLGHSNIENTNTYLHLNTTDLRKQFQKFHPRYADFKPVTVEATA